jgi:hypothetical protein
MQIEVEDNPNCRGSEQFVFREIGPPKPVRAIRVTERGKETLCDVTGVEAGGTFTPAKAVKIADSGAGFAYLIHGGAWGIRLRPEARRADAWDVSNKAQWGEPFKIYGEEEDLIYAAEDR